MNKKYCTISEVSEILGVKEHNLRYLDPLLGKKLTVIRGRRYYQEGDIDIIKKALATNSKVIKVTPSAESMDNLMNSMLTLRDELISTLEQRN